MPRGQVTKDEIRVFIERLKTNLDKEDPHFYHSNPKELAHLYLNRVLDRLREYHR